MKTSIFRDFLNFRIHDADKYRAGTKKKASIFSEIAHDKELIALLLSVSNLDILLYLHATAISCVHYYWNVNKI